jgi:hypothetical protein
MYTLFARNATTPQLRREKFPVDMDAAGAYKDLLHQAPDDNMYLLLLLGVEAHSSNCEDRQLRRYDFLRTVLGLLYGPVIFQDCTDMYTSACKSRSRYLKNSSYWQQEDIKLCKANIEGQELGLSCHPHSLYPNTGPEQKPVTTKCTLSLEPPKLLRV